MRLLFCITLILFLWCVPKPDDVAGGGSDTEVSGYFVDASGNAESHVIVRLIPDTLNPVRDSVVSHAVTDTTDNLGNYIFKNVIPGSYNVQAVHGSKRTRALISGVVVHKNDTVALLQDTVKLPGSIRIELQNYSQVNGYIFIPGTGCYVLVKAGDTSVVLDSVPQGAISQCRFFSIDADTSSIVRSDLIVNISTNIIAYPFWLHSRKLILNTSLSGANVSGTVTHFPVLVRLTAATMDFSQMQATGEDLRFSKQNGTPCSFEVERFDALNKLAEIWVDVDTVFANNDSQSIVMYWGKADAAGESNSTRVFDTSNGYLASWHLSEAGNTTVFDATGNHYSGTPSGMSATSSVSGIIGNAQKFNGDSTYITMQNTANSKLNIQQNGNYSVSAWVMVDIIDTLWQAIASKGHEQYYLKFKGLKNNKATWEFSEFQDQTGWQFTEDSVPPAPGSKTWVYLVGVREGALQRLYINGEVVSSTIKVMTGAYERKATDDFIIGRYARLVTIPYNEGWCYFNGKIDEVRVVNGASNESYVKLCYMNQRADDKLVQFK